MRTSLLAVSMALLAAGPAAAAPQRCDPARTTVPLELAGGAQAWLPDGRSLDGTQRLPFGQPVAIAGGDAIVRLREVTYTVRDGSAFVFSCYAASDRRRGTFPLLVPLAGPEDAPATVVDATAAAGARHFAVGDGQLVAVGSARSSFRLRFAFTQEAAGARTMALDVRAGRVEGAWSRSLRQARRLLVRRAGQGMTVTRAGRLTTRG